MGFHLDVEHKKYDLSAVLEELVAANDVADRLDAVEPQYEYYRVLQGALARYRDLAPQVTALQPLPVPAKSLESGESHDALSKLTELLVLLGDLPAAERSVGLPAVYGAPFVAAVKRFQERNGLTPDGVAGPATFRALNTSIAARVRQTPGTHNALGLVKLMLPNEFDVYLHSTPSQAAFGREERALPHGCVRVERPVELAEFVLKDDPAWTREKIEPAMNAGVAQTVNLERPI